MVAQQVTSLIGEVHCLNCGRSLASVVRDNGRGSVMLEPAMNQSAVQVIVGGRRLLRCRRCGGRAFVELLDEPALERRPVTRETVHAVA